jgi:hypothetical protein
MFQMPNNQVQPRRAGMVRQAGKAADEASVATHC